MNATVAKALFEKGTAHLEGRLLEANGWTVHERSFPVLDVSFTDAAGATDAVTRVEQFRFLGSGETYAIENGALTLTADTADLDEALSDHMIEEMIAAETGTTPADAPLMAAAGALPAAAAAPPAAVAMGGAASQDAVATAEIDSAYANLLAA